MNHVSDALIARGDGSPPRILSIQLDPLGPQDVLVEFEATAVCRTELMTVDRRRAAGPDAAPLPPTVLGHAGVGRVREVGTRVARVAPGDRVVVPGTRQCGRCYACVNGTPGACEEIFRYMTRRVGVTAEGETVWGDGGMGTHATLMHFPESNIVRIDSDLPAETVAMLGCGITSGAGAVLAVAAVRPGESVAISGCGHVGLWMVQAAAAVGASPIIAIDPHAHRRELALAMGATHAVDPGEDPVPAVHELTSGRGADVGLEAAGTGRAMEQSFAATRLGGRVVPTGLESEIATVTLPQLYYALGSKTIIGAQCGGGDVLRIIPEYARLLAQGVLDPAAIVTARFPLARAADAFDADLLDDPAHLTGVILMKEPS